jgi:FkbM family methyltransferase
MIKTPQSATPSAQGQPAAPDALTAPFGTFAPKGFVARAIQSTRRMGTSWSNRQLAFALRRLAIKALGGAKSTTPVDAETLGVRMRLYPYANVCEKRVLFTPQYFDPAEREALAADIARVRADPARAAKGYRFVDIGANVGAYALFVAGQAGAGARILAIEPQPDIFARLVTNIGLNPFGTVKAIACAVADKVGEITLFVDNKNSGESSVRLVSSLSGKQITVPATTLQQLLADEGYDGLDALKLDVEGAEDLILEPFLRQAPEHLWPKLIVIEDSAARWQSDLLALLANCGYREDVHTRLNFVFRRG